MNKLTERLALIAKEIKKDETMADIGTDHGILPLYLWEKNICPHVILTDVNSGPVKTAEKNAKSVNPDFEFDIRQGNGLEILEPYEVDAVVIAGMGGMLISEILENDLEKSLSYKRLILQPRSKQGYLRWFLINNGFLIKKEKLLVENGHFCNIIIAVPNIKNKKQTDYSDRLCDDICWEIPININHKDSLYESYLIEMYYNEKKILRKICESEKTDDTVIAAQKYRIEYMKKILDDERFFYDEEYSDSDDF